MEDPQPTLSSQNHPTPSQRGSEPNPSRDAGGEPSATPLFTGYDVLRELGRGGMGVVYEVHDPRRSQRLALKTLQWMDPTGLYRFKNEFRSLADVAHPNLVNLYELVSDGRVWFFTMELVQGSDFLQYLRTPEPASNRSAADKPLQFETGTGELTPFQLARLRNVLSQLTAGVLALHDAGKLHRDIKPSNVIVTPSGRVVLLDFGLAADLDGDGAHQSLHGQILGTVPYMAPEQAMGSAVAVASDWYSVGVMLYEALTGRLPYLGRPLEVLQAKQERDPPPPASLLPGVPADLNKLCVDLLRRDPAARPSGRELLARLNLLDSPIVPSPRSSPVARQSPAFVGRERHLAALDEAFATVLSGRAVSVFVHGKSGGGKTALVQHFLEHVAQSGQAVVLSGRCYERESVPYKALDSLIDALSRHLGNLPDHEVQALLPRGIVALVRVFPVLGRIEATNTAAQRTAETPDPQELRRRAFVGLRELLGRLSDRAPLVLFIDDLQWGDLDSATLLRELLRPPDAPVLLLLGSYRDEDVRTSAFLQAFLSNEETTEQGVDRRELAVNALSADEACALARTLLGPAQPDAQRWAESIARESSGNPFFVHELVQSLRDGATASDEVLRHETFVLDEVLWQRVLRLPPAARRLLEVVAVAGQPLRERAAYEIADLGDEQNAAMSSLRSGRLIRTASTGDDNEVETYHDRVRETVVAHLAPEALREYHSHLALALAAIPGIDPELLALHFDEGGQSQTAGKYYIQAAAQAAQSLAFDRAAKLYRVALGLLPAETAQAEQLRKHLGDALTNAGRGAEAAQEYHLAAQTADGKHALELRRCAAMQLLISGHIDDGLQAMGDVLQEVGMRLPQTPPRALVSLLTRRAQLWLRGLEFVEHREEDIPAAALVRFNVCWAVASGLSIVDPVRGADFQAQCLLLALNMGEPNRIAQSLGFEAAHVASLGGHAQRVNRALETADALAHRGHDPRTTGFVLMTRGTVEFLSGRWARARELCDQAEQILRDQCHGVTWELNTAQSFALWSLYYLGSINELSARLATLCKEARERGNLYAFTNHSSFGRYLVLLAADEPDTAQRELDAVMEQWSKNGFHIQHLNALAGNVQIALYRGDAEAAWKCITGTWPALSRSLLLRAQLVRIFDTHLRARSALAMAATTRDGGRFLKVARGDARRLEREQTLWSDALAHLTRSGIAVFEGDEAGCVSRLRKAIACFDAADMALYAASTRLQLGQKLGGDEGQALMAQAEAWMAAQGIKNPVRMAAMLTPLGASA
jgi:serine/threonine protein kinase/tetratricopeptide (TPR) repeat protein